MRLESALHLALALLLAPLLLGVVNRIKACFAGRQGPPLRQPYFDLAKALRKGAVYSRTTTWVFRLGPAAGLAAALAALALTPLGSARALLSFPGDLLLLAYLLGSMRFATMLAALDTGSAFEGMGASREAWFSMLAEPALLLALAALAARTQNYSLSGMMQGLSWAGLSQPGGPAVALVALVLFLVLLTENARIPVDDPNTHLELTMIHEAMVLDHGGVDLGLIQYGAALKLWIFAALLAGVLAPARLDWPLANLAIGVAIVFAVAAGVGIVESTLARLNMPRVPQLLVASSALAALALAIVLR